MAPVLEQRTRDAEARLVQQEGELQANSSPPSQTILRVSSIPKGCINVLSTHGHTAWPCHVLLRHVSILSLGYLFAFPILRS